MKEKDLGDLFQESALSYSSRMKKRFVYTKNLHPMFNLSGTLNDHLEELNNKWGFGEPSYMIMYNCLIHHQMDYFYQVYQWLIKTCKSPIEVSMAFALCIHGYNYATDFKVLAGGSEYMPDECEWSLTPQAKIGDYRVDFLLQYRETLPKMEGLEIIRNVTAHKKMVIECDGHNFHERTKKQASRDKMKDRVLQSTGFIIFRFTGSDIWNDVFSCAEQAFQTLEAATHEEAERLSKA